MQLLKSIHKWASLVVGIQFLIWLSSGFYFNTMDAKKSSGRQFMQQIKEIETIDNARLTEPKLILQQYPASQTLKLISLLNKPYYLLSHQQGLYASFENKYSLVDAYTADQKIIDEPLASSLAQRSYSGPGNLLSAIKMSPPISDFVKEKNTVWQMNFDDDLNTSVYIDASSGRLVGHSNDDKRLFEIFLMLHFMDYGSNGSFNSWQIILFAIVTTWLTLTGLIWTVEMLFNGSFSLGLFSKKRQIEVLDSEQQNLGIFYLDSHKNILDSLVDNEIALPSSCGGGGTCGKCKLILPANTRTTSADSHHLTSQQLEEGYRLACQHKSDEVESLTLLEFTHARKQTLVLTYSEFLSPFVMELRFKSKDDSNLSFKAGAYMRFFIPEANSYSKPKGLPEEHHPHWHHIEHLEFKHLACSRSYSLTNYDTQTQELVFTLKIQSAPDNNLSPGVGSNYLCNLNVGETIDAVGPFEEFFANPDSDKTMVMIGAGSGMSPLKSLIFEQLEKFNSHREMHFYYGARTENDLIYTADFTELSMKFSNFNFHPVLSQPDDSWSGKTGYAQKAVEENVDNLGDLSNIEFYLCGPKAMMSDTIDLLHSKGVDDNSIAFDDFNRS
ncbi:MAG: Na+-transporting NADH:ubiquinone oxidoreductase subunit F [Enterobacterales bacterium]|jgi:Na+-transporting NADH:ubiquinone oxidoreductase subunit F